MRSFNGKILKKLIRIRAVETDKKAREIRAEIIKGLGLKSKQSMSAYEQGNYDPPMKKQIWLAEYFGVSVEKFYEEVE